MHLNERRAAEDAPVTLERHRESRHEAEAEDQASSMPARDRRGSPTRRRSPPKGVARATGYGTGCRAFTNELRRVSWPTKFRPELPEKYDGSIDPVEFLQIYTTAVQVVGGSEKVMANYFHVALRGSARSWLMNLSP